MEADEINPEILARLKAFASENGRNWKAKLRQMWATGSDGYSPLLRQARNTIGPSGLDKIRL